jgi:hypothetical protein
MYLFILVLLIVFVIYLYPRRDRDQLAPIKYEVYKYSGLNPDVYHSFLNNMSLMKQYMYSVDLSSKYLYQAIDNLQDLALNAKGGSTGFIDEVHEIASRLGNEAELMILDVALSQGIRFHPKFIKHIPNSDLSNFCAKYPNAPECNLKDYSSKV